MNSRPPLKIGRKYIVPDADDKDVIGTLMDAAMLVNEGTIYGVYRQLDGRKIICTSPATSDEVQDYLRDPDSFFVDIYPAPDCDAERLN